jgi:hypothetical protein
MGGVSGKVELTGKVFRIVGAGTCGFKASPTSQLLIGALLGGALRASFGLSLKPPRVTQPPN